jgi:Mg2+-importing ATPase
MSDEDLGKVVDDVAIFAKLNPMQKARIVGVSVDTAVDIAKDSADMILLEKDLMILRTGVVYGRVTFGNIMKYIKMTTSGNFGNMLSMLYDFSQTSIPWDTVDEEYIGKPRIWDTTGLTRYIFTMGPVNSLFDYITFAVMFFIFGANSVSHQSLFQTGWFVEGLLSQVLVVYMIRTAKIHFIRSRAATPVLAMIALVMTAGIALPYTPAGSALKMTPLPLAYFPYLAGILLLYSIAAHFASNMVEKSVISQTRL